MAKVLVDTCVWSAVLRRSQDGSSSFLRIILKQLISDGYVGIIGPIRQEILSGIKDKKQLEGLKNHLRHFSDELLSEEDYELAAEFFNKLRKSGVQASHTDACICAVIHRRDWSVLTFDQDFISYAKHLDIKVAIPKV